MSDLIEKIVVALIGGVFGGGLLYLAARSKTKGDVTVALAKVDADHETEGRSVAIKELEASLLRLVEENKNYGLRIAALEAEAAEMRVEQTRLQDSEQQCQKDLAFLRGQLAVLQGGASSVNVTQATAAPAAQPTEGTT